MFVTVEFDRKVFPKMTGRAGVTFEDVRAARAQAGDD